MTSKTKTAVRASINILIVVFTLIATLWMAFSKDGDLSVSGIQMLKFYTVDSNILMGIAAMLSLPFDLRKLKGKDVKTPFVIDLLYYIGVFGVILTFLTVIFFLSPMMVKNGGSYFAYFSGPNFFMHFATPILAIFSFFFFQEKREIKYAYSFLPVITLLAYAIFYMSYLYRNGGIGNKNIDWYGFTLLTIPWPVVFIFMVVIGYLISFLIWLAREKIQKKLS